MITYYGIALYVGTLNILFLLFYDKDFQKKCFLTENHITLLIATLYVTTLWGARIVHDMIHGFSYSLFLEGGLSVLGGLTGALLGLTAVSLYKKLILVNVIAFFSPYIPLLHAYGRVGCYATGCCDGCFMLFPLQIIVSIYYSFTFLFLYYFRLKIKNVWLALVYIASVLCERLFFDWFRNDRIEIYYGLSHYQIIAAIGLFIIILFMARIKNIFSNKDLNDILRIK